MNCQKCGHPNEDSAKFCGKCGAAFLPSPPLVPPMTPPLPPARPLLVGSFQSKLIEKSSLLAWILLALFFFPWGRNAVHPIMDAMQMYSKQFMYLEDANIILPMLLDGTNPAGMGWFILHFLFLSIPLAALSLFLWKTRRKANVVLTLVFSFLASFEILRTMILEITTENFRVLFLNGFEGLCLLYLVFLQVASILVLIELSGKRIPAMQAGALERAIIVCGFLLGVFFWLPNQYMLQFRFVSSVMSLENSPFVLPMIIRGNLLFMKMGIHNPYGNGPIGRQIVLVLLGILMMSILLAAIFAVKTGLKQRKSAFFTLGFSVLGLIVLLIRMRVVNYIMAAIQLEGLAPLRYMFAAHLSLFYYIQIALLLALIVLSIIWIIKKPTSVQ